MISSALVPELTATACRVPWRAANASSSSRPIGPSVSWPVVERFVDPGEDLGAVFGREQDPGRGHAHGRQNLVAAWRRRRHEPAARRRHGAQSAARMPHGITRGACGSRTRARRRRGARSRSPSSGAGTASRLAPGCPATIARTSRDAEPAPAVRRVGADRADLGVARRVHALAGHRDERRPSRPDAEVRPELDRARRERARPVRSTSASISGTSSAPSGTNASSPACVALPSGASALGSHHLPAGKRTATDQPSGSVESARARRSAPPPGPTRSRRSSHAVGCRRRRGARRTPRRRARSGPRTARARLALRAAR